LLQRHIAIWTKRALP